MKSLHKILHSKVTISFCVCAQSAKFYHTPDSFHRPLSPMRCILALVEYSLHALLASCRIEMVRLVQCTPDQAAAVSGSGTVVGCRLGVEELHFPFLTAATSALSEFQRPFFDAHASFQTQRLHRIACSGEPVLVATEGRQQCL